MTDKWDTLFKERMKTIYVRFHLNRLIALNLQLFHEFTNYAKQNNIPLPYSPYIMRLIRKIEQEESDFKRTFRGIAIQQNIVSVATEM